MPQIKEKLPLISRINTTEFWENSGLLHYEKVRIQLRSLMKLIVDEGGNNPIYTNLADEVLEFHEGNAMYPAYDFKDYRLKVNRYIEQNRDSLTIYKLRNNIPLTALDYKSLEHIFTGELGTAEDYQREFQDTPFGIMYLNWPSRHLISHKASLSYLTVQSRSCLSLPSIKLKKTR